MYYRTKTYLAGDWDGDRDAIDKIHEWNKSDYYSLFDFVDVHEFVQARGDSLPCSIKRSLAERMRMCKNFLLIVGGNTPRSSQKGIVATAEGTTQAMAVTMRPALAGCV